MTTAQIQELHRKTLVGTPYNPNFHIFNLDGRIIYQVRTPTGLVDYHVNSSESIRTGVQDTIPAYNARICDNILPLIFQAIDEINRVYTPQYTGVEKFTADHVAFCHIISYAMAILDTMGNIYFFSTGALVRLLFRISRESGIFTQMRLKRGNDTPWERIYHLYAINEIGQPYSYHISVKTVGSRYCKIDETIYDIHVDGLVMDQEDLIVYKNGSLVLVSDSNASQRSYTRTLPPINQKIYDPEFVLSHTDRPVKMSESPPIEFIERQQVKDVNLQRGDIYMSGS